MADVGGSSWPTGAIVLNFDFRLSHRVGDCLNRLADTLSDDDLFPHARRLAHDRLLVHFGHRDGPFPKSGVVALSRRAIDGTPLYLYILTAQADLLGGGHLAYEAANAHVAAASFSFSDN
jgi:hypothetical protein